MIRPTLRRAAAALVAFFALFALAPAPAPAAEAAPPLGKITAGVIPIFGFAPFFVAAERGYFADEGLDVELKRFRSGGTMIAALAAGQLDAGGGEVGPALLNAVGSGMDVRVVCGLASQPRGFGAVPLLVRRDLRDDGAVTRPADLAGRSVALNVARGTAEYLLAESLGAAGLSVDDVRLVTLPFPEIPAAFANKAVDAAILPHPLAAKALAAGDAAVLVPGDEVTDNPQNGVVYFGRRLLDPDHRAAAEGFVAALLRAARDLHGEGWRREENTAAVSARTGVPPGAVARAVTYFFDPDGEINMTSLARFQRYHVDRGYTKLDEPLAPEALVEDAFRQAALARLGRFAR